MKQHGFTLIELLIVVGLSSIIAVGAVMAIHQVLYSTSRSNSHVVALDDVGRVLVQIKRDLQSYQTANFTDLKNSPTSLEWTNLSGFEPLEEREHYVIYSLSGTTLYRKTDNETAILGRHIESLIFTADNGAVDVSVTSTSDSYPKKSETFTFTIYRRSMTSVEEE